VPTVPATLAALAFAIHAPVDAIAARGQALPDAFAAAIEATIDPAALALQPLGAMRMAERRLARRAMLQVRLEAVAVAIHPLFDALSATVQVLLDPVAAPIQALFDAVAMVPRGGSPAGQQGHRGKGGGEGGRNKSIHGVSSAGPILQGRKRPCLRAVDRRGDGFRPRL
jgi:hypothetical protein